MEDFKKQATKDRVRKWQKENRDKMRENNKRTRRKLRERVLDFFGRKCCICGFDDIRALQVDHKNGDGAQERRVLRNMETIYRKILKFPHGYQLLCANCNWIKRHENNENVAPPPAV